MILAGVGFAAGANQSRPVNWEKRLQKYRIKKALGEKVISWLSDGNDLAAAECDRLADSLLSLEEPDVRSYFVAAQVAKLRQKPDKAINILEDAIEKYPEQNAPTGPIVPVKIAGRFWIATVAQQSGDITKAKKVYETILTMLEREEKIERLEGNGGLMMMCNLYLAEIEFLHQKRKDQAVKKLEAIERIKKPKGRLGTGYDLYKSWAAYERSVVVRGKVQAIQDLVPPPEMMSAYLLAVSHILLNGIAGEPLAGSTKGMNIVTEVLVDQTIKNSASRIDRDSARLGYGFDQQYKGNFAKAEKYYLSLLRDESFFSPIAGIYLAGCKMAQGKTARADNILEQVRTKYPGYDSAVAKLKESWDKNTRDNMKDD